MGQVKMRHPSRDDELTVSEIAFEHVWKHKGWELVNPYENDIPDTDPEDTRLPVLESVPEDELRAAAEELGVEGWDILTPNELRSLLSNMPEFYDLGGPISVEEDETS